MMYYFKSIFIVLSVLFFSSEIVLAQTNSDGAPPAETVEKAAEEQNAGGSTGTSELSEQLTKLAEKLKKDDDDKQVASSELFELVKLLQTVAGQLDDADPDVTLLKKVREKLEKIVADNNADSLSEAMVAEIGAVVLSGEQILMKIEKIALALKDLKGALATLSAKLESNGDENDADILTAFNTAAIRIDKLQYAHDIEKFGKRLKKRRD